MIGKYGRDAVLGGIEAIMDHSEAATRARVREIPDGVYEAESFMDDDGVNDRRARADPGAGGGRRATG